MTNRISVYQSNLLYDILTKNETVWNVIAKLEKVNLPDCFVGAGCIAQTVWNHFHGFDSASYINDIDLVYFDDSDLSIEKESEMIKSVNLAFPNIPIRLDIKNQARVHLWYKDHFGYEISPYKSIQDAVESWPTTATSIAVNLRNNSLNIIAPFGLDDLINLTVRPNKRQITEEIYSEKINRWRRHWPKLRIISW